jgi:hypothetical protein
MRRSLMAVLGTLLVAASAFAAPAKTSQAWSTGVLQTFDPSARSLVVKQGSHEMTFELAPAARILEGKATLKPDELTKNVGHEVKIRYTIANAVKVADRVEVSSHATTAAHKAPAKGSSTSK